MNWKEFTLDKKITAVLTEKLKFLTPTPVQAKCIPEFELRRDVIAEAPTGSGKTLAYVLPLLQILCKKSCNWSKHEVGAVILVPNRELAVQISDVISFFLCDLHLTQITFVGGKKISLDAEQFQTLGANIIISTPGRLNELLENATIFKDGLNFKLCLKSVEMLILDEADRLFEPTFQSSLTYILEQLPKQKRVGLFSATQSAYEDELKKVCLRNPVKITLKSEDQDGSTRTPSTLKNFYTVTEPFCKLAAVCRFIKLHKKSKILLFVSTCACADYFGRILKTLLLPKIPKKAKNKQKRQKSANLQILTIHGKKRSKRTSIFSRFRSAEGSCLLVCTDVMARGLDVPDIDWVIQFDVPRTVNFFLHRCGRTARCGASGSSLIFLLPNEMDYLDFLMRNQQVELEQLTVELEAEFAEKTFQTIRKCASVDRSLLVKGTMAFVSYIQSYERHDCNIVCHVKDLDIVNLANAYGLLRLPQMPELKGRDLSVFRHSEVKTWSVPFKSSTLEKQRQQEIKEKSEAKKNAKCEEKMKFQQAEEDAETTTPKKAKRLLGSRDFNEIQNDYKLLKKFKKGKISKIDFEDELMR